MLDRVNTAMGAGLTRPNYCNATQWNSNGLKIDGHFSSCSIIDETMQAYNVDAGLVDVSLVVADRAIPEWVLRDLTEQERHR